MSMNAVHTSIPQTAQAEKPGPIVLDRREIYKLLPAMRRAAQYSKRESNAIDRASRILEGLPWYMPAENRLVIKSEEAATQYEVTTSGGCNCPAGRPCLIPGRRGHACPACVDYVAGDQEYRQNHARECHRTKPCKHRAGFELCTRALAARKAPAQPAQPLTKKYDDEQHRRNIEACDDLF